MTPDIEAAFCADAVDAAARRLSPYVRETPLWRLRSADLGLPGDFEIWMKLEQLQVSGSFKARGVFNRLLSNPLPRSGVIVASGGNAGIATAFAANALNVRAKGRLRELWRLREAAHCEREKNCWISSNLFWRQARTNCVEHL